MKMTAPNNGKSVKVNDAVQVGILEMLISPEYSRDWILELTEDRFGKDPDEYLIDEIEHDFLREMNKMARKVAENLVDETLRERYISITEINAKNFDNF